MRLQVTIFSMLIMMIQIVQSQDISSHQWENRLVLILIENQEDPAFKAQIEEFKKDQYGLDERKLLIYSIKPDTYKTGLTESNWKVSDDLYKIYKKEEDTFEVILIGLDGGVKLRQTDVLMREKLFAVIDGMPMRRAELNRRKKEN